VWLFFVAALAAIPSYLAIRDWRFVHWLNTDAKQTTATVTAYDRPLLKYSYTVDQRDYAGRVKTSRQFEQGEKFDAFVSSSHPWMSSLGRPPLSFEGGGYLAVVIGVAVLALIPILAALRDKKSA
jgi:hypothetical protein